MSFWIVLLVCVRNNQVCLLLINQKHDIFHYLFISSSSSFYKIIRFFYCFDVYLCAFVLDKMSGKWIAKVVMKGNIIYHSSYKKKTQQERRGEIPLLLLTLFSGVNTVHSLVSIFFFSFLLLPLLLFFLHHSIVFSHRY